MATTRLFLLSKSNSNHTSQIFLRRPFNLTIPISQSTIIDDSEKSHSLPPLPSSPAFSLSHFLQSHQKLLLRDEDSFLKARHFPQSEGSFLARGRGGSSSSTKQVDSEDEFDDDDVVDEFDDDDDDLPEDFDDDDFDDDDEEDEDDKPKRKK